MTNRSSSSPNRSTMTALTYYDLLQVTYTADDQTIRAAYRRLAKHHHPDTNPLDRNLAAARFRLIQEAYEQLRDPTRRRAYDDYLKNRQWFANSPYNDNVNQAQAGDVFSAARRTLERLMRMMAANRDVPLTRPRDQ